MVLCAKSADNEFSIVRPPVDSKIGDRIHLDGYKEFFGQEPTASPHKKFKMEEIVNELNTDAQGNAVYKGMKWLTSEGKEVFSEDNAIKNGTISWLKNRYQTNQQHLELS